MDVAQLARQSLPSPEARSSNHGTYTYFLYLKYKSKGSETAYCWVRHYQPWWWSHGQRAHVVLRWSEFLSCWSLTFWWCKIWLKRMKTKPGHGMALFKKAKIIFIIICFWRKRWKLWDKVLEFQIFQLSSHQIKIEITYDIYCLNMSHLSNDQTFDLYSFDIYGWTLQSMS